MATNQGGAGVLSRIERRAGAKERAWLGAEDPIPIYGKEMMSLVESLFDAGGAGAAVVSAVLHRY
jgi:hypothetical protein